VDNRLRVIGATAIGRVAGEATMPGVTNGRWLGLAWCCTVDGRGIERDVAFGWTRQQAQRRCLRKLHRRTNTTTPGVVSE